MELRDRNGDTPFYKSKRGTAGNGDASNLAKKSTEVSAGV